MKDDREKWARVRIIMIGTFFGLLFVTVIGRAFYLQILQLFVLLALLIRLLTFLLLSIPTST